MKKKELNYLNRGKKINNGGVVFYSEIINKRADVICSVVAE